MFSITPLSFDALRPMNPLELEVCMGMGKTGIPWVPWDSHGNGNTISHGNWNGMGMRIRRMGMGIKTWEWEKNHRILNYSKLCDSREFMGNERKSVLQKLYTVGRQVLCVPSSAASERVFSTTGRLLEKRLVACRRELWTVFCSYIATWIKDSRATVALQPETVCRFIPQFKCLLVVIK